MQAPPRDIDVVIEVTRLLSARCRYLSAGSRFPNATGEIFHFGCMAPPLFSLYHWLASGHLIPSLFTFYLTVECRGDVEVI